MDVFRIWLNCQTKGNVGTFIAKVERIQKDGTPHRFKRIVYLYHRHKSRIIMGLLAVIALLVAGLTYIGWLLYNKEPGVMLRAKQFTVFQHVEEPEESADGYYIIMSEEGEPALSPVP